MAVSDAERAEYLQELQESDDDVLLPAVIFLIFMAGVGIIGNSLVLVVYSTVVNRSATSIFIIAIAVVDLCCDVILIPSELYLLSHLWDYPTNTQCKIQRYINIVGATLAGLLLPGVAFIRLQKVSPRFKQKVDASWAKKAIFATVVLSFIIPIPVLETYGIQTVETSRKDINGSLCSSTSDKYIDTPFPLFVSIYSMLVFVLSFMAMSSMYTIIGRKAWKYRGTAIYLPDGDVKRTASKTSVTAPDEILGDEALDDAPGGTLSPPGAPPPSEASTTLSKPSLQVEMSTTNLNNSVSKKNVRALKKKISRDGSPVDPLEMTGLSVLSGLSGLPGLSGLSSLRGLSGLTRDSPGTEIDDKRSQRSSSILRTGGPRSEGSTSRSVQFDTANATMSRPMGRTTVMLFVISVVFAVSYIPVLTIKTLRAADPLWYSMLSKEDLPIIHLFRRCYFVNGAVNPIVYSLCDFQFRRHTAGIFKKCFCFCKKS